MLEVAATAGQVLMWTMDGDSHAYRIELSGPDGQLLRRWPAVVNGKQEIGWITTVPGNYRLEARRQYFPADADKPVSWWLKASGAAYQETAPERSVAPADYSSPLLLRLQEQLEQATPAQQANLIEEFWSTVQQRGTPLLDALASNTPANNSEVLSTFLWRAPAGSADQPHHISLDWGMRSAEPFVLQQVPGTDIWQLSLVLPRGLRTVYELMVDPVQWPGAQQKTASRMERLQAQQLASQRDLLNPHIWTAGSAQLPLQREPARHTQRSVLEISATGPLLNKPSPPIISNAPLNGTLDHLRFASGTLANTRSLSLYLPPGQHAPTSLPLLILFDRESYLEYVQIHRLLEQWIEQGLIPPVALLLVANPTRADRAKELPPQTPAFGKMLSTELLPWLRELYPTLSREARQVVVAGSSFGGLAAGYLGWSQPETFGNVLSLSGSFWWAPTVARSNPNRWSEQDWLMREIANAPASQQSAPAHPATRWFLSYGLLERGVNGQGGIVDNNRHLRNVLQARGYPVSTHEYAGGHDYYVWGDEILHGLQALLEPEKTTAPANPLVNEQTHNKAAP